MSCLPYSVRKGFHFCDLVFMYTSHYQKRLQIHNTVKGVMIRIKPLQNVLAGISYNLDYNKGGIENFLRQG